jgi:hypothetical protein
MAFIIYRDKRILVLWPYEVDLGVMTWVKRQKSGASREGAKQKGFRATFALWLCETSMMTNTGYLCRKEIICLFRSRTWGPGSAEFPLNFSM